MRFRAIAFVALSAAYAQDAREIFRRSIERDRVNRALLQQYTYIEKNVLKEYNKDSTVKSAKATTRDISIIYDHRYARVIEREGKPLSEKEQQKEKERLEKLTAKWQRETAEERQKRLAEREKNREKSEAFLREIPDAYDLRLVGEEKVSGHDTWVIQGEPHPGYQPKTREARFLAKVHGKVWIDKAEYQWVRIDAESLDTISFGLVLFRLSKGSRMEFEATRVNDEIWLPSRQHIAAGGRVGLFFKASIDLTSTYENYRKFQSDSRVVNVTEPK